MHNLVFPYLPPCLPLSPPCLPLSPPLSSPISDLDKMDILSMRNSSNLYQNMVASICPSVFGHLEVCRSKEYLKLYRESNYNGITWYAMMSQVKRGILLMMLGGVHKVTPEGISLRCVRSSHCSNVFMSREDFVLSYCIL